jgi:hypothetical protein
MQPTKRGLDGHPVVVVVLAKPAKAVEQLERSAVDIHPILRLAALPALAPAARSRRPASPTRSGGGIVSTAASTIWAPPRAGVGRTRITAGAGGGHEFGLLN